jgi:hypothetical protein
MGLGALATVMSTAPAEAITMPGLSVPQRSDIVQVHDHHGGHHHHRSGGHRWHGYDGYYDNYDNSGLLFKSFVTGTLFNRTSREASYGDAHTRACADRYRSYDAYDNTYQPSRGPRRQCR